MDENRILNTANILYSIFINCFRIHIIQNTGKCKPVLICFLKKDFAFLVTSQSRVMAILSQKIHLFFRQDLQKFDFSLRGF